MLEIIIFTPESFEAKTVMTKEDLEFMKSPENKEDLEGLGEYSFWSEYILDRDMRSGKCSYFSEPIDDDDCFKLNLESKPEYTVLLVEGEFTSKYILTR